MLTPEQIAEAREKIGMPKQGYASNESPMLRIAKLRKQATIEASALPEDQPVSLGDVGKEGGATIGEFLTSPKGEGEGLGSKIVRGGLSNIKNFGESIAGAIFANSDTQEALDFARETEAEIQGKLIKKIKEKREKGEDTDRLMSALVQLGGTIPEDAEINPAIEKTGKQIAGEAVGVATDIIGAGSLPSIGKTVMAPTTFFKGALKGLGYGALTGGTFGGLQGGARAAQEDKTGTQIASEAAIGGAIGGVTGGVIGGITGGVSGWLNGRRLKADQAEAIRKSMMQGDLTDADTAEYMLPSVEKVDNMQFALKKDPTAQEAIRQGIPERDVALVKVVANSPDDLARAQEMTRIAEKASKSRTIIERPMDIAGDTAIKPAKHISKIIQDKGKQLDVVAEGLVGQPVDYMDDLVVSIDDELARHGVSAAETFEEAGEIALRKTSTKLNFEGSDFEGLGTNKDVVNNVYGRLTTAKDAHDLHRLKTYIDSNVTYGKTAGGLTGDAERMLKGWRRLIDQTLDNQFSSYNQVNTELSEMLGSMEQLQTAMGRKFSLNDPYANIRAGQVSSRLLGNSPNRGEVLQSLLDIERIAKKYGFTSNENVFHQVNMADILEDVYGTQATRGFAGGIERSVDQMGGVVQDVGQGQVVTGLTRLGLNVYEKLRGVNEEALKGAFRALLKM
jgi:hypothetical protein